MHFDAPPNSAETIKRVRDFLKSHPVAMIATVGPRKRPHATIVYISVNDDLSVSFVTKRGTEKYENIKKQPAVMLVIYEASSQSTVQITGRAVDITHSPEATGVFKDTLKAAEITSDSHLPPISKLEDGHYVAYKVMPKQIRMAVFARPDPGGYEMYETLYF